jgi:2-desacetyl-2-hydroxyethyl bacteriochlorophyllide A dehydrogenase
MGLQELSAPACGPQDVLLRSELVGICGTDVRILRGALPRHLVGYPCIPGHEWVGTVIGSGDDFGDLDLGDRVVAEGRLPCEACRFCLTGETHLCTVQAQLGFDRPGGFAEVVAVPRRIVHRLPDDVTFESGVLLEPASCVQRGLERVEPVRGESVGIVGIGTLGAISLKLVRLYEPGLVVAFGVRKEELALAAGSGADHGVDVTRDDVGTAVRDLAGDGLDVVIEAAGNPAAIDTAVSILRPGGRLVLLGLSGEDSRFEFAPDRLVRKDLSIVASLSYTRAVWSRTLDLLREHRVDLHAIVTQRLDLDHYAEAFAMVEEHGHNVGKVVVRHRGGPA